MHKSTTRRARLWICMSWHDNWSNTPVSKVLWSYCLYRTTSFFTLYRNSHNIMKAGLGKGKIRRFSSGSILANESFQAWNLLRNPISIFALFAILFLIKSWLFRGVLVFPHKFFLLWEEAGGKLGTTGNLAVFYAFMNAHALPIPNNKADHTPRQYKHTPPKHTLMFTSNRNY